MYEINLCAFKCVSVQDEPPVVTIIADQGGGGGDDSNYAIRFSSELVVISSIKFLGSPGSITFDDVDAVIIENSAFRSVSVPSMQW